MTNRQAVRRKFHFIYQTTCQTTGKYYRGMHSTDDMDDGYLGSGYILHRSIKKHGKGNHERVILEDCSERGRAHLRERERFWVDEEQLNDPLCMNVRLGGGAWLEQRMMTGDEKRRASEKMIGRIPWNKGKKMSDESRQKMSAAALGRKHNELTKMKMSLTRLGVGRAPFSDEHRRNIGVSQRGRVRSPEFRRKVSAGSMGRVCIDETRMKISQKNRGRKHTVEARLKMSMVKKELACQRKSAPLHMEIDK